MNTENQEIETKPASKALPSSSGSKSGIERAMELRSELFDIANSYAGDETGHVAVTLHQACNKILAAKNSL